MSIVTRHPTNNRSPQPADEHSPRDAFSIEEISRRLGVPSGTVRTWIRRGVVRGIKIGGRRLVPATEYYRLLASPPQAHPGGELR